LESRGRIGRWKPERVDVVVVVLVVVEGLFINAFARLSGHKERGGARKSPTREKDSAICYFTKLTVAVSSLVVAVALGERASRPLAGPLRARLSLVNGRELFVSSLGLS